jgi:hypothetical protein
MSIVGTGVSDGVLNDAVKPPMKASIGARTRPSLIWMVGGPSTRWML